MTVETVTLNINKLAAQSRKAVEVLADGEWHPYREVTSKIAATVPPGIAVRRAERARKEAAVRAGYRTVGQRWMPKETADLVRIGALIIARQTLVGNKRLFEIDPSGVMKRTDVERKVRLRPGVRL